MTTRRTAQEGKRYWRYHTAGGAKRVISGRLFSDEEKYKLGGIFTPTPSWPAFPPRADHRSRLEFPASGIALPWRWSSCH